MSPASQHRNLAIFVLVQSHAAMIATYRDPDAREPAQQLSMARHHSVRMDQGRIHSAQAVCDLGCHPLWIKAPTKPRARELRKGGKGADDAGQGKAGWTKRKACLDHGVTETEGDACTHGEHSCLP